MAVGYQVPAPGTNDLNQLVHRSRLLGADTNLVIHGGGNTSVKTASIDHLGRERPLMYVKGSGVDLASVDQDGFVAVYLDDLQSLGGRESMTDEEMMNFIARCRADDRALRPSIETLLHALLPYRHVDHVHADAICVLTKAPDASAVVREALGRDVALVPYLRPGFSLAKHVAQLAGHDAIVLAHHGLVTWGDTAEESFNQTTAFVQRAADYLDERADGAFSTSLQTDLEPAEIERLLLRIRGVLSADHHRVLAVDPSGREFADRTDVDELAVAGPATADHVLRIRTWSAVVRSGENPEEPLAEAERRYEEFFAAHAERLPAGTPRRDPKPAAVLIPGLGTVAAGDNHSQASAVKDVAWHTHKVAAQARSTWGVAERLSDEDLFDLEYWPLELAKLDRTPQTDLQGRIYLVTGAASGIGRDVALRLAASGSELVLGDIDPDGLEETAKAIERDEGTTVVRVPGDLTDERVIDELVHNAVRTFGGIDGLVSNAGIGAPGRIADLSQAEWQRSFDINATSHFLVTRRLLPVLEAQGLGGSLVYVASKNALSPGAGFGAYSAAKAAQVQFARVVALEGASIGVRSNVINPDAVFEGSRLWSKDLRRQRAANHGVAADELEDFYTQRNLLKLKVHGSDVALAVEFLLSDRSSRTTGGMLNVDGGVAAAFPR